MTEDGQERYYLQDEMGSPIRLLDEDGDLEDSYGYDEFGQDLYGNQGIVKPFGYTGYQTDRIAGTYYAQAREYRAELGRFAAVDTIKGFTVAPYTLNEYGYCWNKPTVLVDWDGRFPQLIEKYIYYVLKKSAVTIFAINECNRIHYDRNSNQKEYFSQYDEKELIRMVELGEDGWYPAAPEANKYHRFTDGNQGSDAVYNVKYLKELEGGKSYEIIICERPGEDDDYVVDVELYPENAGTYNYQNPDSWGVIGHALWDVIPYYLWGNSEDDGLTLKERIFGNDVIGDAHPDNKKEECIDVE